MQYHSPSANASNVAKMMASSSKETEGKHIKEEKEMSTSKAGASGGEMEGVVAMKPVFLRRGTDATRGIDMR